MADNSADTSRLRVVIGAVSFEIEGTEALVRDGMTFFKESIFTQSVREVAKDLSAEETKLAESVVQGVSLRELYQDKKPMTDMERVTVLAYLAKEHRGMAEVSEAELQPLFHEVGDKLPKNVKTAIHNAARKVTGWLESTGKPGYYRISNAGFNYVRFQLPKTKK